MTARAAVVPSFDLRHAARTVTAAMLALWLAYFFDLDTPYSAAVTVFIVGHPVHGMVLSKSFYRLGGTLLGAGAAILLMAAFGQCPELFIVGLSVWMGACVAASTLLHSFRSYGAMLAGYTAALITMPAVAAPLATFDIAANRVAVVALGIACSALVASLTTTRSVGRSLEGRLAVTLAEAMDYARRALSEDGTKAMGRLRRKVAADIAALEAQVEFAAIESPETYGSAHGLRGAAMAMLSTLTAATAARDAIRRNGGCDRTAALAGPVRTCLADLSNALAAGDRVAVAAGAARLADLRLDRETDPTATDMPTLVALDRLQDLLDETALCLDGWADLDGRRESGRRVAVRRHADPGWAAVNGLRAAVAVWLVGVLWLFVDWSAGPMLLATIVPSVALLSLRDRPDRDALAMLAGMVLAAVVGLVMLLGALPRIGGFPLLCLVLAPPLFAAVVASTRPGTAFAGVGFTVFLPTMLAPSNPMVYAPEAFLNTAMAVLSGGALTVLVHRLVLPVDPRRHVRVLIRAILADARALVRGARPIARLTWETRMHARLVLLGSRMRSDGVVQENLLQGAFAALRLGREILRIRALDLADCRAPLLALARLSDSPSKVVATCDAAAHRLLTAAVARPEEARPLSRAAASFMEIALLLGRHRRFFQLQGGR